MGHLSSSSSSADKGSLFDGATSFWAVQHLKRKPQNDCMWVVVFSLAVFALAVFALVVFALVV